MIRKQLYMDQATDRKLKALARSRRCSESEVMRDAIRLLPEPATGVAAMLEAAGFRHWEGPEEDEESTIPGDLAAQDELDMRDRKRGRPASLSDAVVEEREDRV